VDTAPLLERDWPPPPDRLDRKNTMVLKRNSGSYFLGEIGTTAGTGRRRTGPGPLRPVHPLPGRLPDRRAGCPVRMDASRCISYLTIELRDEIEASSSRVWATGYTACDICQEVCPYNAARPRRRTGLRDSRSRAVPLLADLLSWDEETIAALSAAAP